MKSLEEMSRVSMSSWGNAMQAGMMIAEAQAVISMRLLGMAGVWSVPKSEDARMVSEKVHAMTKAMTDASKAAMEGKAPDEVIAASIKPLRKATRANSKRLAKRGLK